MSDRKPTCKALEVFAAATEPTEPALARVRRRVLGQVTTPMSSRALLRHLAPGGEAALARVREGVRQRLEEKQDHRPGQTREGRRGLLLASPFLVAAAVLLAVAYRQMNPAPPAPALISLQSPSVWTERELTPGVHARFQGDGLLYAHADPALTWREGTIDLTVEPNRGHRVSILTEEAEVRVIGTLLSVQRDALGTHVQVSHGKVEVRCVGAGADEVLLGGQATLCLPTTGAGLLGRAQALEQQGASSDAVLAAVEAGLAVAQGPIEGELRAFRIQHLLRIGRYEEALSHIEAYLASGAALRRTQMLRAAARLSQGRCRDVLRYLEEIPSSEQTAEDERLREGCGRQKKGAGR